MNLLKIEINLKLKEYVCFAYAESKAFDKFENINLHLEASYQLLQKILLQSKV